MIDGKSIALVLPAHNEQQGLLAMLPKMPKFIDEVIIVDNNSTDGTARMAEFFGGRWYICTVICEKKQGYGASYKNGFRCTGKDIVVCMDADDTYPLDEVERCVYFLLDNNLDFVSCSRFPLNDKHSMKWINYVGNRLLTTTANLLFGLRLHDITTGMWVFRNWVRDAEAFCSNSMAFTVEFKLKNILADFIRFGEMHIGYRPRVGKVKLNWWRDGVRMLWAMLKMRCER